MKTKHKILIKTINYVFTFILIINGIVINAPLNITKATEKINGSEPTEIVSIDGVNYYKIYSANELAYIEQEKGDWLTYNYILANDIAINDVTITFDSNGNLLTDTNTLTEWVPINGFTGIFNGDGHSISGIYENIDGEAGLFIDCEGDIYNLSVTNSYIKGTTNVGGICGSHSKTGGYIKNCSYSGAICGVENVGGIVGCNGCTYAIECTNYGEVWGTGNYIAGIIGYFSAYGIQNCNNYGKIHSEGHYVGGICGSTQTYDITNCINHGDITGISYVGGICGQVENAHISGCGNWGLVIGKDYVGGICGTTLYYFVTSWMGSVYESYNAGNVVGEECTGGITGYVNYAYISYCYNVGNVSGNTNTGAIVGQSQTIWGKGTVKKCYYLQTETINSNLCGFGNSSDIVDIVELKDLDFFCIKNDTFVGQHSYDNHIFEWSEDGKMATITFVCVNDANHTMTHDATIKSELKIAATCSAKGTTTYIAKYGNYTEYKDMQDIERDANNHTNGIIIKNAKKSTYKNVGYTGDQCCKSCGKIIVSGKTIAKKKALAQKIIVSNKAKNTIIYNASSLKKNRIFHISAKAKGKITYKVSKRTSKYVSVSPKGKVTIKKGCKKGTYKIIIIAAATSNGKYKKATKSVTIKIK